MGAERGRPPPPRPGGNAQVSRPTGAPPLLPLGSSLPGLLPCPGLTPACTHPRPSPEVPVPMPPPPCVPKPKPFSDLPAVLPERRGRARVRVRGRKMASPRRSPRRSPPKKPRRAKGLKPIMVYYCLNKKVHQNVPARCQSSQGGPSTSRVAQPALSSAPRQGALGSSEKIPVVPAQGNGQ